MNQPQNQNLERNLKEESSILHHHQYEDGKIKC